MPPRNVKVLITEEDGSELPYQQEMAFLPENMPLTSSLFTATDMKSAVEETRTLVNNGLAATVVSSTTGFTTSSTTDVVITGFTSTPVAGTYLVLYNSSMTQSNSTALNWWSVYKAGVQVSDSERSQRCPASNATMFCGTVTRVSVNGSQSIDVRVRANTGSITINNRSLVLIRLGAAT